MEFISWLLSNLLTVLLVIMIPIAFKIGKEVGYRRGEKSVKLSMSPGKLTFKQRIDFSRTAIEFAIKQIKSKLPAGKNNAESEQTLRDLQLIISDLLTALTKAYDSKVPHKMLDLKNTRLRDALGQAFSLWQSFIKKDDEAKREMTEVERLGGAHNSNQQGLQVQNGKPRTQQPQVPHDYQHEHNGQYYMSNGQLQMPISPYHQ